MITIAEAIRLATSQNRLHPFVRDNWASPRGLCNCSKTVEISGTLFCQRDYGHTGKHMNGSHHWEATWPPTNFTGTNSDEKILFKP